MPMATLDLETVAPRLGGSFVARTLYCSVYRLERRSIPQNRKQYVNILWVNRKQTNFLKLELKLFL